MDILTGDEHFLYNGTPINRLLNDFWAWQSSDLLNSSIRGALAEYIVATALDLDYIQSRNAWNDHDLEYQGKSIEVKSSAYLQSLNQSPQNGNDKLSRICFTIYPSRPSTASLWDNDDISRHSDLYVFCLFSCKDRATANPMSLEQWDFYIIKTTTIDEMLGNQRSVSLSSLIQLPVIQCNYDELKDSIDSLITEELQ